MTRRVYLDYLSPVSLDLIAFAANHALRFHSHYSPVFLLFTKRKGRINYASQ